MTEIELWGDTEEILPGFSELAGDLRLRSAAGGLRVEVRRGDAGLCVRCRNGAGFISYRSKSDFCRAIGHLAAHLRDAEYEIRETRRFDTLGVMADASRNAVPTVEAVKRMLRCMALMGFNRFMLYTEDTYAVPGQPYFGYMRGRYTREELRACDDCADRLGIEMIPCIQTLAHMPRVLQWQCYEDVSDTEDILLAGEPKTYRLLEELITAASAPFRSNRIHIGMDEAHFIGLGQYLTRNGARPRFDILCDHLEKTAEIARKHHLKPMIWSDMFYRLLDPSGDYADVEIPREVTERIPESVQLVYWNYYSSDKELYLRQLRQHERMKPGTVFAGGVWTWNGMAVSCSKTLATTLPAVEACREVGIRDVLVTLWGDDGAETDLFQALLGLQLYAELSYTPGAVDRGTLGRRFRECTGGDPDAFWDLDRIDNVVGNKRNEAAVNTSKLALYQDIMTGLFDFHFRGRGLSAYYGDLTERFRRYADAGDRWAYLFAPLAELCAVLSRKADMGLEITRAYREKDSAALGGELSRLEELRVSLHTLKDRYRELWLHDCKPFGFEVLDIRLGGVIARVEYAQARIGDYLAGRVKSLPELEEERLPHERRMNTGQDGLCRFNRWHRTVTTSYIGHNIP